MDSIQTDSSAKALLCRILHYQPTQIRRLFVADSGQPHWRGASAEDRLCSEEPSKWSDDSEKVIDGKWGHSCVKILDYIVTRAGLNKFLKAGCISAFAEVHGNVELPKQ